jgi:hypothetical protein
LALRGGRSPAVSRASPHRKHDGLQRSRPNVTIRAPANRRR